MAGRSLAREVAFQVLYQDDLNPRHRPADDDVMLRERIADERLRGFAGDLISGVRRHRQELDQQLSKMADNWSLSRITPVDRNILRLGAFEVEYSDTPRAVAIDEAIELAKRFGTAESAKFVNGILDKIGAKSE